LFDIIEEVKGSLATVSAAGVGAMDEMEVDAGNWRQR
jgi:hypothetical protein